jgi:hypothetical protein
MVKNGPEILKKYIKKEASLFFVKYLGYFWSKFAR